MESREILVPATYIPPWRIYVDNPVRRLLVFEVPDPRLVIGDDGCQGFSDAVELLVEVVEPEFKSLIHMRPQIVNTRVDCVGGIGDADAIEDRPRLPPQTG